MLSAVEKDRLALDRKLQSAAYSEAARAGHDWLVRRGEGRPRTARRPAAPSPPCPALQSDAKDLVPADLKKAAEDQLDALKDAAKDKAKDLLGLSSSVSSGSSGRGGAGGGGGGPRTPSPAQGGDGGVASEAMKAIQDYGGAIIGAIRAIGSLSASPPSCPKEQGLAETCAVEGMPAAAH